MVYIYLSVPFTARSHFSDKNLEKNYNYILNEFFKNNEKSFIN